MLTITCIFTSMTVRIIHSQASLSKILIPLNTDLSKLSETSSWYVNFLLYNNTSDPTGDDYETYLYGQYDAGWSIYNPGNELSLRFESSEREPGFQLVYYQLDPGE